MTFKTEFPDFPVADMPEIPAGFEDTSWHNDACPSFTDEKRNMILYVDFADKNSRDVPELPRFILMKTNSEGVPTDALVESEDWSVITTYLAGLS